MAKGRDQLALSLLLLLLSLLTVALAAESAPPLILADPHVTLEKKNKTKKKQQ